MIILSDILDFFLLKFIDESIYELLKKAKTNYQLINITINNPVQWLTELIQTEESNDENSK
ncbi:MAG: hypothetical protein ACKO11_06335 [Cuspidothrix sp.]